MTEPKPQGAAAAANTQKQTPLDSIAEEGRAGNDLVKSFVSEVLAGSVILGKDTEAMIIARIAQIDHLILRQLSEIIHHPEFQKLEGRWRGLHYLVSNSATSGMLRINIQEFEPGGPSPAGKARVKLTPQPEDTPMAPANKSDPTEEPIAAEMPFARIRRCSPSQLVALEFSDDSTAIAAIRLANDRDIPFDIAGGTTLIVQRSSTEDFTRLKPEQHDLMAIGDLSPEMAARLRKEAWGL